MSEPWPDNWVKLTCPNGHELTEFSEMQDTIIPWDGLRVYGFCPVCHEPWIYQGRFNVDGVFPARVPISVDGWRPLTAEDLPPVDLKPSLLISIWDDDDEVEFFSTGTGLRCEVLRDHQLTSAKELPLESRDDLVKLLLSLGFAKVSNQLDFERWKRSVHDRQS